MRRALVERHRDVRAERCLDVHRRLGSKEARGAVEVILKVHPLLGDLPEFREREHLEAAAVGQDRSLPAHEPVQAAELPHHFHARPHEEVIGIAEDDLRA